MQRMMKALTYPWNNLAIELAVKLYESHYSDYELGTVYEFQPEAEKIILWCKQSSSLPELDEVSGYIKATLDTSMNHSYDRDAFIPDAKFILSRLKHLNERGQLG